MSDVPAKPATATEIYAGLAPYLADKPINETTLAMVAHLAAMIDLGHPGMGDARKASMAIGEQIWAIVIDRRNDRLQERTGKTDA